MDDILRFIHTLKVQQEKLIQFSRLLDLEYQAITSGNTEKMEFYKKTENQSLKELQAVQKVINPMDQLFTKSPKESIKESDSREVEAVRGAIEGSKQEIQKKITANLALLKEKMGSLGSEIREVKKNIPGKGVYRFAGEPTYIDIKT